MLLLPPPPALRREMLDYTDSAVTRNASEKKINSLLDFISTSTDLDLLQVGQGVDTGSVCAPEGVGQSKTELLC